MKKLQRFENFNKVVMGSDIFPFKKDETINTENRIEDFKKEFEKIVNYSEEDFKDGNEPTMNDILSEVGDLCNKYEMSKSDLKTLIDNNEDIDGILQIMYEDTEEDNNSTLVNLENMIRDIIQGELYLRDVPYSMEDGAQEVDPDSLDDASKAVINLLKKEGYIK